MSLDRPLIGSLKLYLLKRPAPEAEPMNVDRGIIGRVAAKLSLKEWCSSKTYLLRSGSERGCCSSSKAGRGEGKFAETADGLWQ